EYGIPFIMANNIRGGEIQYGACYHISLQQAQTLQKGFAKTGDVLLTHKGTVGEVAIIGRIEFPYLMLTPQVTYYRICDTSKLDTYFLATAFRSNSFQKPLKEEAGGGTRAYIGITAQKGLELSIPQNIEEQKELGNYFQKLDTLITQHRQKHDKLNNLKKAMLEKMFPKAGETVPEIRFEGFNGDWEKTTLGSYTTFRRGSFPQPYGNKEWYGGEGSMPFVQVVDVNKKLSLVDDTKQKISVKAQPRSVFVSKGSVVVTLQGTIGRVAFTQYDCFVDRTILIFQSFSRRTDPSFWAYTIQTKFDLEKKLAPGGTIKTITKEALSSFDVLIPSTEEQVSVGNYFKKLDRLINHHSQQITKLKNIKQACLDKMFV
ncbi:MAG: restriction endonuclease subunit S, partial [Paraglaciecola sp.]